MAQRSSSSVSSYNQSKPRIRKTLHDSQRHSNLGHRSSSAFCPRPVDEDNRPLSSEAGCYSEDRRPTAIGHHRRGRSAEPRLEKMKTGSTYGTPAFTFLEVPPTRSEIQDLRETIPEADDSEFKAAGPQFEPPPHSQSGLSAEPGLSFSSKATSSNLIPGNGSSKFQSLQRLLSQNSAIHPDPAPAAPTPGPAPGPGEPDLNSLSSKSRASGVIILDSAVEASTSSPPVPREHPESISWIPQRRISVDREECLKKEQATLSIEREEVPPPPRPVNKGEKEPRHIRHHVDTVEQEPVARHHQVVTVSRNRTWSFPDKLMQNVMHRRVVKDKNLKVRQSSLIESSRVGGSNKTEDEVEDVRQSATALGEGGRGGELREEVVEKSIRDEGRAERADECPTKSDELNVKDSIERDVPSIRENEERFTANLNIVSSPDPEEVLTQRDVIIHRDEKGYGLTLTGDNPIYVQSIKENGAAARAGVLEGEEIVKVNGTLVTNSNHIEVVKLIKSNSYATLTLRGRRPGVKQGAKLHNNRSHQRSFSSASSIPHDHHSISSPRAVDHDKDLEFKAQKIVTIRMMLKQVQEEYDKMKLEYRQNPTERLQLRLEVKTQMLRRVEDQLNSLTSELASTPEVAIGSKNGKVATSANDLHRVESRPGSAGGATGLPPDGRRLERNWEDASGRETKEMDGKRRESSPLSDSDARRSSSPPTLMCFSTQTREQHRLSDDSGQLSSHGTNLPSRESAFQPSLPRAITSQLKHSASLRQDQTITSSSPPVTISQANVISIEDDEFNIEEDQVSESGIFSDLGQLKLNLAHLAVFLHYLLSNSDPSPLLFYLITESYPTGTMKELRKWAYEIYSSFLAEKAPLVFSVDDTTVSEVECTMRLKSEKEEAMKAIFVAARKTAENEINDLLADFRSKRALGLGSLYGDHELKESMDRSAELKIVDHSLWKHFERFAKDEDSNRHQALASALATFFKQIGLATMKANALLDRVPVFLAKDKKVFKFTKANKRVYYIKGHSFIAQHYFVATICHHCQTIVWGIGNQGYQCTNCEMNIHPHCRNLVLEICSVGSLRKKQEKERRPTSVFEKIISRKPSMNIPLTAHESLVQPFPDDSPLASSSVAVASLHLSSGEEVQDPEQSSDTSVTTEPTNPLSSTASTDDYVQLLTPTAREVCSSSPPEFAGIDDFSCDRVRSESFNQKPELRASVRRAHSDVMVDSQSKLNEPTASSGGSSNSSLSFRSGESASNSNERLSDSNQLPGVTMSSRSRFHDSDLEVEPELPALDAVIPKDLLKKLKPKEKKRQEVINELFYTERAHVRNLKVMHRLLYRPMSDEAWISPDLISLLFPNLDDVIDIHVTLNNDFKSKKVESPVVGDIAHILVNRFSGVEGENLKVASARFCQHQSHALEVLRQRLRKDQKLAQFLQDAASHPLCRRLELKDLIPTVMQRLTKYPLLIENLLKYTVSNTAEYDLLLRAHDCSKDILNHVNQRVQECENHQKLVDLQRRLDKRPIENSSHPGVAEFKKLDLTRHRMIYDGEMTWRISRNKQIDLHVVLLEDLLVLLQRQDERLVMRCQSTNVVTGKEDLKLTHSPIIKLSSILTRNVATDKRALFLVSTSDFGPQIYELVASSKDEKNRWFKYITDAAESYKSKDSVKNRKPANQPTAETQILVGRGAGGGGGGSSTLYETTKPVANGSRRQDNGDGEDRQEEAGIGYIIHQSLQQQQQQQPAGHGWRRVEALRFEEEPVLVQPDEVKISLTQVVDRHSSDTTTPLSPIGMIREKNRMIEVMLVEKRNLVANILQIPFHSYDHICEVVDEVKTTADVRELMLSSLTQADLLTQLINDQLDAKLVVGQDGVDPRGDTGSLRSPTRVALSRSVAIDQNTTEDDQLQEGLDPLRIYPDRQPTLRTAEEELPIVVPCSRLMAISRRLRSNLTQLMELVESRDREMVSWETELSQCNDHLRQLAPQGHRGVSGRPTSQDEDNESSAEQHAEYVTSSWEAVPVRTEHLEVIEAERIIEPERVVKLVPNLLPGSVTVTKLPGAQDMMPSANDTR